MSDKKPTKAARNLAKKARTELSRAITTLILSEPFYGHVLSGVVRETRDMGTAGVGLRAGRVRLAVDPTFFVKTLRKGGERVAVVKHEVLHLVLRHLFRRDLDRHDPLLFNIAADLVVNQLIGRWPLPEGAILLSTFPDLGLEPDQTVDWYYSKLRGIGDKSPLSAGAVRERRAADEAWHSDHSHWGDCGPAERKVAEVDLGGQIVRAARRTDAAHIAGLPGLVQGALQSWIESQQPSIDWRRVLRMFGASSRRSRIKSTMRRPSKRYGTFPGHRVRRFAKLVVAVDTSGSVHDDELGRFFGEIHGLWRNGAEIQVVECDAAVQRTWTYRGKRPATVMGRGGTSFDPVFRWMREQRDSFDGCIYLTDGEAYSPVVKSPAKVLWVITPNGTQSLEHLKGRTIRMPRLTPYDSRAPLGPP